MNLNLRILLLIFSFVWLIVIFKFLKGKKIPIKYSLVWLMASFVVLLIAIFPDVLVIVASLFGFKTISNMVIGVILTLLLIITLNLTMIVSKQKRQIVLLIQELSILKKDNS